MRGWRALLLTMVLLTGCLGGAPEGEEGAVDAASVDDAGATAATGTSAASGSPASASASEPTPQAEDAELAPVVIPVAFEGSLPAFVEPCAWTLVGGTCVALPPAEFNNRLEIAQSGTLTRATLTLTWTPSSPVADQLGLVFYSYSDEELTEHARVFGPSPLTLEVADVALPEGQTHEVVVFAGWTGGFVLVGGAEVAVNPQEQPFSLDGELVLPAAGNP